MFEVLWKSGDTTWLPYYQITHLQALTDYLDLIGISKISKLPPGSGQPPVDDPQIFLGALSLQQPEDDNSFSCSLPCNLVSLFKRAVQTVISVFNPPSFGSINSPTVDLDCIIIIMPKLRGINHPSFTRISPTHYTIRDPKDILDSTIHVSQIADYLRFDEQLRAKGLAKLQSIPLGFDEFAHLWNTGARETDPRRIRVPESIMLIKRNPPSMFAISSSQLNKSASPLPLLPLPTLHLAIATHRGIRSGRIEN